MTTTESPPVLAGPVLEGRGFLKLNESVLRDPNPYLRLVREECGVFQEPDFGVFLVTRYEDIREILRQPDVFSSIQQADAPYSPPPAPLDGLIAWRDADPAGEKLITNDPPDHTRYRQLVKRFFTVRRVAE